MGILRADRITGLGGANAIKGSTQFSNNRFLEVHGGESNEDFRLSNGSFTIEFWAYVSDTSNSTFVGLFENNPARRSWMFEVRASQALRFEWWTDGSSGTALTASTGSFIRDRWHHFAVVRNGTALNIYVDGTSVANTTTSDTFYENTIEPLTIGGIFQSGGLTQEITGFISNLRIIKGEAIYTANFTPPTSELTVTSNTVVLACQSPGNLFQEATGKTIIARTDSTNDLPPQASHFRPNSPVGFSTTADVGSQYGSTFNGFGNFATSTYMVPPGGNTRERNRGRALFGGGSTIDNTIQSLSIQSLGNTEDFGDLSTGRYETECASSSTRGIWGGGYTESPNVKVDVVEFVTIANSSNTTDFGNLTVARGHLAGMCNSTRGVFANGSTDPGPNVNTLDYITIATAGNATDFGDSTTASKPMGGGRSSTTRGIFTLGNAPSAVNNIEYITIASTGDSQDFGDLTGFSGWGKGAGNISSGTRAILGGGHEALNNIEYITIASLGNGTNFGDLIVGRRSAFTAGSKTRGVFAGGKNPSQLNSIEYIEIATTGNAVDFGDMINSKSFSSGLSDCHGGLS